MTAVVLATSRDTHFIGLSGTPDTSTIRNESFNTTITRTGTRKRQQQQQQQPAISECSLFMATPTFYECIRQYGIRTCH